MSLTDLLPYVLSAASLVISGETLYYTNFRKPRLSLLLGSTFRLSHPPDAGFSIIIPITITNQSAQPGHVHKVSLAMRMPHVQRDYRYVEWRQFLVFSGDRNVWDTDELAHPILVPGKSSVSKVVQYMWHSGTDRFITDVGQYELQALCWTSTGRRPQIIVKHSFSVTPVLQERLQKRLAGQVPSEFAKRPPLPPGHSYTTDIALDGQFSGNAHISELELNSLITPEETRPS